MPAGTTAAVLRFPQVSPMIGPWKPVARWASRPPCFVLIVAVPLAFFPQSRDAYLDVKILLLAGGRLLRRGSATSSRPSRTTR
jgi:hypothetical protein